MSRRNVAFDQSFARVLARAWDKANQICRIVAYEIGADFIKMSPVDTGRFKNNWVTSVGTMDITTTVGTDPSGAAVLANLKTVATEQFSAGKLIYITNSLPYAKPLEYGHSQQAPQGMVRLTIQNYAQKLAAAAKQLEAQK